MNKSQLIEELIDELCLISPDGFPNLKSPESISYISEYFISKGLYEEGHRLIQYLLYEAEEGQFTNPVLNKKVTYKSEDGEDKEGIVGNLLRLAKDSPGRQAAEKSLPPEGSPERDAINKDLGGEGQPKKPEQPQQKGGESGGAEPEKPKPAAFDPNTKGGMDYIKNLPDNDPAKPDELKDKSDTETPQSDADKKITAEIEKEKADLSEDEKKAYDLLDGLDEKQKAAAIDEALQNRSIWQKFKQDTILGSWLSKKGRQFSETASGIKSLIKHGKPGVVQDCSGTSLKEAPEDRQRYLASLGKDGKPKTDKEPKDKSGCKDVHYSDFQKKDENGKPVVKVEEVPAYDIGDKPDPKVDLNTKLTKDKIDAKTGYYKLMGEDGKPQYFDAEGVQCDENGTRFYRESEGGGTEPCGITTDTDNPRQICTPETSKPRQKVDWRGRPVVRKVKKPVFEDGIDEEQLKLAKESLHQAHEQVHAMVHTALEVAAVGVSLFAGPAIMKVMGIGTHSTSTGAGAFAEHLIKDVGKHSAAEMMGAPNLFEGAYDDAITAGGIGVFSSALSGGMFENQQNDLLRLVEEKGGDSEFFQKLLRKTLEKMKTYKLTPEQKLKSIRDYKEKKKKQAEKDIQPKSNLRTEGQLIRDAKIVEIAKFIKYANERLALKERPTIKLVKDVKTVSNLIGEKFAALGGYVPSDKTIYVLSEGRLVADILRTIAHEMVHRKQEEMGFIKDIYEDGRTGSKIENQANSIAGILLREWGSVNEHIYLTNEDFEAISKKTGKKVQFKTAQNRDAAIKRGTHSAEEVPTTATAPTQQQQPQPKAQPKSSASTSSKADKKAELKEKYSKKSEITENMVVDGGRTLPNGTRVRDIVDENGNPIEVNTTEGRQKAAQTIRKRLQGLDNKIKEAIKNFGQTVEVKKWLGEVGEMSALAQILEEDVEAYLLTDSERKNDIVFIKSNGDESSLYTGYLSVKTTLEGEQVNKLGANCKADLDKLTENAKPEFESSINGKTFKLKPSNVLGSVIDIKSAFFAKFSLRDGVEKTSEGKLTEVNPNVHRNVSEEDIVNIGGKKYFKDQSSYLKNTEVSESDINEFFDNEVDKFLNNLSKPKKGETNQIADENERKQTKEYLREIFLSDLRRKTEAGQSYTLYDMHDTMHYAIGKTSQECEMPIEATTDTMSIEFAEGNINPKVSVIKKEDANQDIQEQLNKNKEIVDERERISDLSSGCLNIRSRTRAIGRPLRYDGIDNISPIAKKPTEKRTPIAEYVKS